MSSNPFRRKPNDGTPSASGRTSLDIDQERLQQVAQQAFADADGEVEQAGSPGATTIRDVPPSTTTTEIASKESAPVSQPGESGSHDGLRRQQTAEVTVENERKPEIQVERPGEKPTLSISSVTPIKTLNKTSDITSTPPPSRPLAPPAPPRPRRSVKRPRDELPERKASIEENPIPTAVIPSAPAAPGPGPGDPFVESKLRPEDFEKIERVEKVDKEDDESSIYEITKEDVEIESIQSIESEYEEDSGSEISEARTASAASLSAKTVTSEPEYIDASASSPTSPQTQAPNPFRKKDGNESPIRRQSSDAERNEKREPSPPRIKFGLSQNTGSQGLKASRQSLDVDAFKHLMLTGQTTNAPDSVTTTETSNLSKQSLLEGVEHSYTPRSSQDTGRSGHDAEDVEQPTKAAPVAASPPPKPKPPPPKPRGQRNSMMMMTPLPPHPESETTPTPPPKESTEVAATSQEAPATPPKTPKPPVPLSRRLSARVTSSSDGHLSFQSNTLPQPPPPPPPPSRYAAPVPSLKEQPTAPPIHAQQEPPPPFSLNTSPIPNKKPIPPPTRRGSKRLSAPPGRLQAAAASISSGLSKNTSVPTPPPPPPPIRKKTLLSQSTAEGAGDPVMESPPRTSSSFDILEDLTKLQKEVDELMGRV
ncbi:hypothetical protein ABW20_dc0104527 [Dactylellina cionopaga]|nr:hypothetical protein ABW20_dc0104527 [Dactylellina cionopaga]